MKSKESERKEMKNREKRKEKKKNTREWQRLSKGAISTKRRVREGSLPLRSSCARYCPPPPPPPPSPSSIVHRTFARVSVSHGTSVWHRRGIHESPPANEAPTNSRSRVTHQLEQLPLLFFLSLYSFAFFPGTRGVTAISLNENGSCRRSVATTSPSLSERNFAFRFVSFRINPISNSSENKPERGLEALLFPVQF